MSEWRPIESAPKGVWLIGRIVGWESDSINAPYIVGKLYDMRPNALLDPSKGRWVSCTHWTLPPDFDAVA